MESDTRVTFQPAKMSQIFETNDLEEITIEEERDIPMRIKTGFCCDSLLDTCSRCASCCTQWCFCYRLAEQNF